MKQQLLILSGFFLLFSSLIFAQDEKEQAGVIPDTVPFTIDNKYREDQFYLGLTYNILTNKPDAISQSGFSGGFTGGFVRDFPVNQRRNLALGIGLGWTLNTYGQNLFIGQENNGETIFRALGRDLDYATNRFSFQMLEVPLEFRWRTSTPQSYKFWRIYAGLKPGYIYYFKSNFKQTDPFNQVIQNDVPELEKFRLGATFTFGYNTFNFHFYYNLIPLFAEGTLNDQQINISPLRIGLMFYIL